MSNARSKARRFALQALYQWQLSGLAVAEIETQFIQDNDLGKVDMAYFHALLQEVVARAPALDTALAPLLGRSIDEVDPVERAILRMATYELIARVDIPYRVVINEAIELAKTFGAEQGHRYINGVLDRLASRLRADEVKTPSRRGRRPA